ncbi:MAG: metallophosphoesterase [Ruminococcaceae bacterium]|nr:metallophosphoesterase [Oscillospiraceae bacterium]
MEASKLYELATTIPEYWQEYLEEKIKKIHENQIKAGPDSMSFGIVSDIHWRTNQMHTAALMEKILTDCSIPYFFNAGDLFSGQGICKPEANIAEFIDYRKLFARIEGKCLIAEGNHDAVYSTFEAPDYYAQNISLSEFYEYYFRHQSQYPDRVFGPTGTYYYADDKLHKTRLVVLNTHDIPDDSVKEEGRPVYHKFRITGTGIRQAQLNWFANVALDVPSTDWTVVLCTHEPMCYSLDNRNEVPGYGIIVKILNAFKKHTKFEGEELYEGQQAHFSTKISVDYTGRGGNFAVWVGGHTHWDYDLVLDGVLSVATLNDGMHNSDRNPTPHEAGTTNEQAFDIYTIDKTNHKLYVTRIGAGNDREFEYEVF